jgi:hypothetical protein
VLPFSPLLRIKKDQKFVWGDEQQKAFNEIKEYMKEPPVLVPPQLNKPFKLYVAADAQTIGSALIQEFEGKERVVAYLSQKLLDPKTRYSVAEKICLCVVYANFEWKEWQMDFSIV